MKLLAGRLFGNPNNDITDIEEAIETGRAKRAPTDLSNPSAFSVFKVFSDILFESVELTKKVGCLEGSISLVLQHANLCCNA